MIVGRVNRNREAVIALTLRDSAGQDHAIDAVVDTGFNGSLTLPSHTVSQLGLDWHGREQGTLADGRIGYFEIYAARIIWDGHERLVETAVAEGTPLVGMNLLKDCELRIRIIENGEVSISPLVE
jgi:clan AA aspartic protease